MLKDDPTVRGVALHCIAVGRKYYKKDLLKIIPKDILKINLEAKDVNVMRIAKQIDKLRFERERRLRKEALGLPDRLRLVTEQQFLFNVAATVLHF